MADGQTLPPEIAAPLARFHGERPPAPQWFEWAIAQASDRSTFDVDGAAIELLTWGEIGKPGLLFLHGNGAHADWWSFIAPFFAQDWRVAAISWSGMGNSAWRERYDAQIFVQETMAAIEAAGLNAGGKPVVVGHSFGGHPALGAPMRFGDQLRAVVALDTPIQPPERRWRGPPVREGGNRVYPTLTQALARFRLAPPQPCEHLYIVDYIARASLKQVEGGWTWKFDPDLWRNYSHETEVTLPHARCPVALMWGDRSGLLDEQVIAYTRSLAPAGTPTVIIPDADHHVMLDQPLACVAAIRALLAGWL